MSAQTEFSRTVAEKFLRNVVFVDDEIFLEQQAKNDASASAPTHANPFQAPTPLPSAPQEQKPAPAAAKVSRETPYDPRTLVESFAKIGIACALYQPLEGFKSDRGSDLFRLCDRADIVILDWDLFHEDGANITPLLTSLANASETSVPHHMRLCIVYSGKPQLIDIVNKIRTAFSLPTTGTAEQDWATVNSGATRIVVFGKVDATARDAKTKAREVDASELAKEVVGEFAAMHQGLLASYALHGLAVIRNNTKRVLDKFTSDMDGPFVLNRALTIESEDAFDQLPELIAEETLAAMQDAQISENMRNDLISDCVSSIALNKENFQWSVKDGLPSVPPPGLAVRFLQNGVSGIESDMSSTQFGNKVKKEMSKNIVNFHSDMGCDASFGHKKLAALYSIRTRYASATHLPMLGLGTIVRSKDAKTGALTYSFCLMPLCDSIRLDDDVPVPVNFPMWTLEETDQKASGRGIVVRLPDDSYLNLAASGKVRERLWIAKFSPDSTGVVRSVLASTGRLDFVGTPNCEWIAQAKPSHAQRIASDIGHKLSRVGLAEAEWVRLLDRN